MKHALQVTALAGMVAAGTALAQTTAPNTPGNPVVTPGTSAITPGSGSTATIPALGATNQAAPSRNTGAPAAVTTTSAPSRTPAAPVSGANSYTESEARGHIGDKGFSNVQGLKKDAQGIWRGTAMKDGKSVNVALDYQGNVVSQ